MSQPKNPYYVPIATHRNKQLMKDIVQGVTVLIDVVNSEMPHDRSLAKAWIDENQPNNGAAIIWFEDAKTKARLKFGSVDEVRALMLQSETVR
ncbi:hypothetical protein GJ698_02225 [Pseudoduganella sp. FT26W]|uniref:Uncharacterized protein n=1 Tax=Duganella aquatilis TaxID=2666082 RepID=A0A844D445_9BURK|nr:hypothetical protein [Duganella aquatilis]MRW82906.1 hypothetical protein [Duganella aquatilis]